MTMRGSWEFDMSFVTGILKIVFIIVMFMYRLGKSVFNWFHARQRRTNKAAPRSHAVPLSPSVPADPLVLRKGEVSSSELAAYNKPAPSIASRVCTFNLVASTGLPIGVGWLYLYAEQKTARRVVKFEQMDIARAVCGGKKTRYYFSDVPYNPENGIKSMQEAFVGEIKSLLNRKAQSVVLAAKDVRASASVEMPRHRDPKPVSKEPASVYVPTPMPEPVQLVQETAESQAERALATLRAAVPAKAAGGVSDQAEEATRTRQTPVNVDRTVQGITHNGTVVQSGFTQKTGNEGSYQTFCLTIHDGKKEVPLTGVEIQRQASDLKLAIGDSVRIVDMGRQTFEMPSGKQGWRNLYQVSLIERARA